TTTLRIHYVIFEAFESLAHTGGTRFDSSPSRTADKSSHKLGVAPVCCAEQDANSGAALHSTRRLFSSLQNWFGAKSPAAQPGVIGDHQAAGATTHRVFASGSPHLLRVSDRRCADNVPPRHNNR